MKKNFSATNFLKAILAISVLLAVLAFRETWLYILEQDYALWRSRRVFLLIAFVVNIAGGVFLFKWDPHTLFEKISQKIAASRPLKFLGGFVLVLGSLIPPAIILFDPSQFVLPGIPMAWVAWWIGIIVMTVLYLGFRKPLEVLFATALLAIGFAARMEAWLPLISTYPFSLGWSEGSRYYYASLFFSKSLYGEALPWSFLHPSRYILQAIPFLFGKLPLWFHRAWQVFLWFGLSLSTGIAFARRISRKQRWLLFSLTLWFFLFILQGAVYYHLQVAVLIILLGFKKEQPLRSTIAVLLASLWAGISRVNWIPVPAMLAILLFLLEEPVSKYKNIWRYLTQPIIWTVVGIGAALASQSAYVFLSGNTDNIASFGSSFTSSLLWYRLLPNNTYKQGIVFGTLYVSFALFGILFSSLYGKRKAWHWIRLWGAWAILLVLLLGGLVVSTKIGGGGDLHNMDGFLVVIAVWGGYIVTGGIASETSERAATNPVHRGYVAFAVLIPFWLGLQLLSPMPEYDLDEAGQTLSRLQEVVGEAAAKGEQVLFISQRHLLTTGLIEDVPMVADYEVIVLMEMAMSGNMPYLEEFHRALSEHRFGLIVASPQFLGIKDESESFAEENNAWIQQVSTDLVCAYEPLVTLKKDRIVVFAPKASVDDCSFSD